MLLMLSAAPVLWVGDAGLKLRDLVVEFSRWVLGPRVLITVEYHRPLLVGGKRSSSITTDGFFRSILHCTATAPVDLYIFGTTNALSDCAAQAPNKERTASKAPSPKRKVPASKAKSLLELATVATVAPTNANSRNLKKIGSPSIAFHVVPG